MNQHQPVIIPEADFLAMVAALGNKDLQLLRRSIGWWKIFLYLAYYLGLRRGEIFGLTWDKIRLDSLELVVSANTSKGRKDRVVPMAQELAQLLRAWNYEQSPRKQSPSPVEVSPWPFGNYRPLYDDWHAIQTAAGIPADKHYVPKNCRSSGASEMIAANVPTATVKDFLGHASVVTTERYYINAKPALRSAVAARKVRLA